MSLSISENKPTESQGLPEIIGSAAKEKNDEDIGRREKWNTGANNDSPNQVNSIGRQAICHREENEKSEDETSVIVSSASSGSSTESSDSSDSSIANPDHCSSGNPDFGRGFHAGAHAAFAMNSRPATRPNNPDHGVQIPQLTRCDILCPIVCIPLGIFAIAFGIVLSVGAVDMAKQNIDSTDPGMFSGFVAGSAVNLVFGLCAIGFSISSLRSLTTYRTDALHDHRRPVI